MLLLFVCFTATPTVIGAINKSDDLSYFYGLAEEELTQEFSKEYKIVFEKISTANCAKRGLLIISTNDLAHDSIFSSIFSPPPNA